jgi:hypothetical protein
MSNKDYAVYVRFTPEDVAVLDRLARETDRKRSELVRHLTKLAIQHNLITPVSKPAESVSRP